jgi:hypothetical protein
VTHPKGKTPPKLEEEVKAGKWSVGLVLRHLDSPEARGEVWKSHSMIWLNTDAEGIATFAPKALIPGLIAAGIRIDGANGAKAPEVEEGEAEVPHE